MIYYKGDYVRLESNNEIKEVVDFMEVENKTFYLCDDDIWYDENFIYPSNMKIQTKCALGESLTMNDFGGKNNVLDDISEYVNNVDKKEFKKFLDVIRNCEMDFSSDMF
jgi:hypothetical protein